MNINEVWKQDIKGHLPFSVLLKWTKIGFVFQYSVEEDIYEHITLS